MDLSNVYEGVLQKCAEKNKAVEGDYIVDGLLYCGKCRTPKQCRITDPFGHERTPFCLCQCETDARDREKAEREERARIKRIEDNRREAFPEYQMRNWTFENDDQTNEKLSKIARNYVEHFDTMMKMGKGLLLFGETGRGKSFAAACIVNALVDKGYRAHMTNFTRIDNTARGLFEDRQEFFDSFNDYALLVLDDLATERKTEYMQEIVKNVIEARCDAGLPTIVTTNLTSEELKNPKDITYQRIFSRLLGACQPIEVTGKDRRRERLKDEYDDINKLLGI